MAVTLCGKCFLEVEEECMCEDNPYHQRAVHDSEFMDAMFRKWFGI